MIISKKEVDTIEMKGRKNLSQKKSNFILPVIFLRFLLRYSVSFFLIFFLFFLYS